MITLHIFWTLAVMITYLGIIVWTYDKHKKGNFDTIAKSILEKTGGEDE